MKSRPKSFHDFTFGFVSTDNISRAGVHLDTLRSMLSMFPCWKPCSLNTVKAKFMCEKEGSARGGQINIRLKHRVTTTLTFLFLRLSSNTASFHQCEWESWEHILRWALSCKQQIHLTGTGYLIWTASVCCSTHWKERPFLGTFVRESSQVIGVIDNTHWGRI